MTQQYYDRYQTAQVTTADKVLLVLMLYERAIALTKKADEQIRANDLMGKSESISKLLAIITGLMNALDFEKGKEIAVNFSKLYRFAFDQLIIANRKMDAKPLVGVLKIFMDMKEGWEHVVREHRNAPEHTMAAKQNLFHVVG